MIINWNETLMIGHEQVDAQHKILVDISNELYDAIKNHASRNEVKEIFKKMLGYATYHFAFEEPIFTDMGYRNSASHTKEHHSFTYKIKQDLGRFEALTDEEINAYVDFLRNWLVSHIMVKDRRWVAYYKSTKGI